MGRAGAGPAGGDGGRGQGRGPGDTAGLGRGGGRGGLREPDDERGPDPGLGLEADLAAVALGDLADDGQAEAGAAVGSGAALVGAPEAVEDVRLVLGGDAGALVGHGDPGAVALAAGGQADAGAGGGEA